MIGCTGVQGTPTRRRAPPEVRYFFPIRALLTYTLIGTPICVLIFLVQSAYFSQWDGHAVSVRGSNATEPSMYTVLIKNDDGTTLEQIGRQRPSKNWCFLSIIWRSPLGMFRTGREPKEAYTLTYRVQPAIKIDLPDNDEEAEDGSAEPTPEPEWSSYGTTSPQALAIALIAWIVGLGLRNMLTSGSPLICSAVNGTGSKEQRQMGSTGQPNQSSRSRKTAPSGQTSRKNRRRRR